MARILIVGATGLVGGLVLEQALADTRIERVVALTRRPIPAGGKLENVVVNFAALPSDAGLWSVDGVVCALGTTRAATPSPVRYRAIDHDYPLAVARRARVGGATACALISSLGADPSSRAAYLRLKGDVEVAFAGLGYDSLTILRPSMLAGTRPQPRPGERLALSAFRLLGPLLPVSVRASPAAAVASAALRSVLDGRPGQHVLTNADLP